MKTFRDLKAGDRVTIKGYPIRRFCDKWIDGAYHNTEWVYEDVTVTITSISKMYNRPGIGFGSIPVGWKFYFDEVTYLYSIFVIETKDLDKTETEKYIIVQ